MKKLIAWPLSQILYWIGDILSNLDNFEWTFAVWYPIYRWCMVTSMRLSDWADLDIWKTSENV